MSKKKYIERLEIKVVDLCLKLMAAKKMNEELRKEIAELKSKQVRKDYEQWLSDPNAVYKPFIEG